MSDLEVLQAMLKRAKVEYTLEVSEDTLTCIDIEGGYAGFHSCIMFNTNGSLHSIEAYE